MTEGKSTLDKLKEPGVHEPKKWKLCLGSQTQIKFELENASNSADRGGL